MKRILLGVFLVSMFSLGFSQMTITPSSGCAGTTFNLTVTGLNVANVSSACGTVATGGLTTGGNVVLSATLSTNGSTGAIGSLTIPSNFTPGSYGFKVTAGCNNVITNCSSCFTVITTPAQPSVISGPSSPCVGTANNYSVTADGNATNYTWTLPNTWTGNSTSNLISATTGTSSGSFSVTANNTCGSSSAQSLSVTVNDVPGQPTVTAVGAALTSSSSLATQQWYLDGNLIQNATGNSYTATQTGNYTVVATNTCGNSLASAPVHVTISGIQNTSLSQIKIYPNPVKENLLIENTSGETLQADLFSLDGKLVSQISVKEIGNINMSKLLVGVYMLKLGNGKLVRIEKITKQ